MRKRLFTAEQEEFFIKHQAGLRRKEIADLMHEIFGLNLSDLQISDQRSRLKINGGKLPPHKSPKRLLTDEQEAYFLAHQKGLYRQEAADMMNKKFGLKLTTMQVKQIRHTLKIGGGELDHYRASENAKRTQFKKGHVPYTKMKIGSEVIKTDGYLWRKIAEPNKWKQVHILLWEEAHGQKSKEDKIIFLNGNRLDVRLDNLALVSNSVNAYLNTMNLRYSNPEMTKAGINVAKLLSVCHQKIKQNKRS